MSVTASAAVWVSCGRQIISSSEKGSRTYPSTIDLAGRSSDAESDSDEVRCAEMIHDGNQPFMPSVTSSRLQADRLERQVQVIMHDDHILNVYPEIVRQVFGSRCRSDS